MKVTVTRLDPRKPIDRAVTIYEHLVSIEVNWGEQIEYQTEEIASQIKSAYDLAATEIVNRFIKKKGQA